MNLRSYYCWTQDKKEDKRLYLGFSGGSVVKNLPAMQETPGLGRSPREGNGNPLQHSCLGNPMDRGAWWAKVHGVTKSLTQLSNFTFTLKNDRFPILKVGIFCCCCY